MSDFKSVRLSNDFLEFLKKISRNRIKLDIGEDILTMTGSADLIVNYFKNNNERYLKMIKEEENV